MILINSSPKDTMRIFRPFSRYNVPVGAGYLSAVLEREHIPAKCIDEQVEENTLEMVTQYVKNMERPYIFGFSVLTAAFSRAVIVSKRLKELYPDSIILFGGIHPTAMPEEVLSFQHVDLVFRGEAETVLPDLYRCLKKGGNFMQFDGLSYRQNGQFIHNKRAACVVDLDSLPPFPYHLFTSPKYDLGAIVSSRGCPHECIFCSNRITTGKRYRYRSAEAVVDEIQLLHHQYGKTHILFLDDNLLVNKKRLYALIEELQRKGLEGKLDFTFQGRGDNVNEQLLKDLYKAGFRNLSIGLETASERIMKLIKKGETVAQCMEAVRMAKNIGFHVSAVFIYGFPTETHEERMDCVRLSREYQVDMVRFNNATPYPGTELYDIAKEEGRLRIQGLYENFNSVSAFIENPFKRISFSYVPIGSTEAEIRNDILASYLAFYLSIDKIRMMLLSKSGATKRWFNPGNRIKDMLKKIPALFFLGTMLFLKFGTLFVNILLKRNTLVTFNEFIQIMRGPKAFSLPKKAPKSVPGTDVFDNLDSPSKSSD